MMNNLRRWTTPCLLLLVVLFPSLVGTGCATNPVTGRRELYLIPESQEIQLGAQYYGPTQQMEGGPYETMPELTEYVSEIGQRLAEVSERSHLPYEFVVLNSSQPNAWALPGGKIAINRGLLTVLENEAELASVLGHEIVHADARHSAQQMERQMVGGLAMQVGLIGLGSAVGDHERGDLIMTAAHTAAALGSAVVFLRYGREAELEADRYGMEYMSRAGYDPIGAVTLQEKFVELSGGAEAGWFANLFSSHPPSAERVRANREIAERLPKGGTVGRERYQERISSLVAAQPAYDAFDEGVQALGRRDQAGALAQARKAMELEPREGMFDALEAHVLYRQGNKAGALNSVERAISKNPNFFGHHLVRGQILRELGQIRQAEESFRVSHGLLPTAEASVALGLIAQQQGRRDEAIGYFRHAAQFGESEAGRAAIRELVPLEAEMNPAQFVEVDRRLDEQGYAVLVVRNRSGYPLSRADFAVSRAGVRGTRAVGIQRELAPGQAVIVRTGIGPFGAGTNLANVIGVQVLRVSPRVN